MEKSKVAVVACPDYEPARVKESLQKGLEAIGGLESLIGKEENILLKPNLVRSAKRERAVVTDPEVMDALITILQENGYENISCGDSCGLGTPEGIAKEAGLKEVLEKHNVPLKDFLTSERVKTADGKFLMIAKDALDCDALISVSKMKTHALERITGAVKMTLGLASDGSLAWQGCNQGRTNLLDNPDFSNPINQRGLTTYSGSFIYSIDRWVISGTISLQSGGISVSPNGFFLQRMEPLINGEDYTLAVYVGNQLLVGTVTYDSVSSDTQVAVSNSLGTLYIQNIEGNLCQFVVNTVEQSIISMPVLLKGAYTAKTLPPWTTPDYVMEYMKCLRYYRELTSYGRIVFKPYGEVVNTIVSSEEMRILPTVEAGAIRVFDDSEAWVVATVASVTWMGDGYKVRLNVNGTVSNGNTYLMQGFTGLTADL